MDLPRIEIHTVRAETGIQTERPPMSIRQRPADIEIDQDLVGTFRISTTASKLYIDQSEAFADADLKGPLRRNREMVQKAHENVMEYIAKTARQGERLKRIEHGGNALAEIAREKGERKQFSYNIANVPKNAFRVKFHYVPSEVHVDIDWPDPEIRVKTNEPEIHIPRWRANVYLKQKNSIHFSVVQGETIDKKL